MADSKNNNVPMYLFQGLLTLLLLVGGFTLRDIQADVKASEQANIAQNLVLAQMQTALTTVQEDTDWRRKKDETDKKHWTLLNWTKTRLNEQRFTDGLPPLDWPDMTGITIED